MTRRYIVGMVTAILALWGLALEASAGSKWDLVLYVGITHPVAQYFKEFAGEVKKRTRGELEIVVRPSGELPYKITEIARVVGQGPPPPSRHRGAP
ncbi:MAG: hypothetical protein HYY95_11300 [Candidatus Rokubacteria bacterium]|nr:hypothetical protein [Candidatus Rokubacteria bacterium]MBI3106140.1 hypothetical protein [Candidatus Rokubacteria bacterium]